MKADTLARLAVAGSRTDLLRTVLTAASASLAVVALLAAATVGAITGYAERYTHALLIEPGLRPGVMIGLVLTALPVLALAGQCIRLGAPARDRRLAAIRLAGATPQQAVLIATAETAVAGAAGSVLGLGAYFGLRAWLARRNPPGQPLSLPTDVLPSALWTVLILVAVPLLAALIGAVLMRRVIVTPLGVVRRTKDHGPRPWPGLLIAIGVVLFGSAFRMPQDWVVPGTLITLLLAGGVLLTTIGVVLGTGWISYTVGRLLRRFGRGPATLLAGQRLITDPWSGSRTLAALLASVVAGAVALGFKEMLAAEFRVYDLYNAAVASMGREGGVGAGADPEFYFGAIRLVMVVVALGAVVAAAGMLVALAESIVARRRSYAALTAGGVPRRTLSAAVLWQTLAPLLPALLLALGAGLWLIRLADTKVGVGGFVAEECTDPRGDWTTCAKTMIDYPLIELAVPVPMRELALLGGGALLAVLLATGAGLLVLRSSTDLEELRVG